MTDSPAQNNEKILALISQIAHDMRSPFASLQSFLNILEMEEYRFGPAELKEIAEMLKDSSEKALAKVDSGLDELKDLL